MDTSTVNKGKKIVFFYNKYVNRKLEKGGEWKFYAAIVYIFVILG
jgi:hypothetical protein